MAYTAPTTVVAGQTYSASAHNVIVNDVIDHESRLSAAESLIAPFSAAWTSYTPQIDQGATTNIAKTVVYAKYLVVGKMVTVNMRLSVTGTGTTNNGIIISLPVAPTIASADIPCGSGWLYDNSASQSYYGIGVTRTAGNFAFLPHNAGGNYAGVSPNIPLGNGDVLLVSAVYEAA